MIDFDLKLECWSRSWTLKQRLPIRSNHLCVLQMMCLGFDLSYKSHLRHSKLFRSNHSSRVALAIDLLCLLITLLDKYIQSVRYVWI